MKIPSFSPSVRPSSFINAEDMSPKARQAYLVASMPVLLGVTGARAGAELGGSLKRLTGPVGGVAAAVLLGATGAVFGAAAGTVASVALLFVD